MNSSLTYNTLRYAGATRLEPAIAPVRMPIAVGGGGLHFPPLPASLPLANSRTGNVFADRNDPNLHWYLPEFALADDVDPSFAFAASQTGQDGEGRPFNVLTLTFSLRKNIPVDAAQFASANPGATMKEIPFDGLSAVLTSLYLDDQGNTQERTFTASSLHDAGGGTILIAFNGSIHGDSVVGVYQDLRVFGKASLQLSASYQAWVTQGALLPPIFRFPLLNPVVASVSSRPLTATAPIPASVPMSSLRSLRPISADRQPIPLSAPVSPPSLSEAPQSWAITLPIGLKYNSNGYQLKYTVSTVSTPQHVIVGVNDLSAFTGSQSEFLPLTALGDLNARYPSISRAYVGVISRSIVVIPQRYAIARGKNGCAAYCLALVDSTASSASKCKFEFDFCVAPEVSRIEMWKFQKEVLNSPDLNGYHITFPDFLKNTPASTLQTTFASTVQFSAGTDAQTFAITVSIQDDPAGTPAVANANLFIMRLCSGSGADLVGTISLKLDDGYASDVLGTIDLNFLTTSGTNDEIAVEYDEANAVIQVTNELPLDLKILTYGLVQETTLAEHPGAVSIPVGSSVSLPLPSDHAGMHFVNDAQLDIPMPLTKQQIPSYLNFKTVDVQETSYVVSIDGASVDYTQVSSIEAQITFPDLPTIAARALHLSKSIQSDSTQIVIPLENALFSLPGTVSITVHFVDTTIADLTFSVTNDFISEPVLILQQSDINKNIKGAAS